MFTKTRKEYDKMDISLTYSYACVDRLNSSLAGVHPVILSCCLDNL